MESRLHTLDHHHDNEEEDEVTVHKPAMIFDAEYLGEAVPSGFDAVRIPLNGRVKSDLTWKSEQKAAKHYVAQGYRLFWDIDLGFHENLEAPLGNHTQFLSLCLSLEHFRDTLWREFKGDSIGLCLYRGWLDPTIGFSWDDEQTINLQEWMKEVYPDLSSASEEIELNISNHAFITSTMLSRSARGRMLVRLFCRNVLSDYLAQLAAHLPDSIPLFALFDASTLTDPFLIAQLLTKERYPAINQGVKGELVNGTCLLGGGLGWEGNQLQLGTISRKVFPKSIADEAPLGICLPKSEKPHFLLTEEIGKVVNRLTNSKVSFRIIPESHILTSWEGLERLVVESRLVDRQLYRVLQGFAAAGGTVEYLGEPIGIAGERPYHD